MHAREIFARHFAHAHYAKCRKFVLHNGSGFSSPEGVDDKRPTEVLTYVHGTLLKKLSSARYLHNNFSLTAGTSLCVA